MHGNRRVLVTGGAGFIGSHLCRRLLNEGSEVLCVDNFYSSTRRNITDLLTHPNFELLRHDVTFPLYVEIDQIYSLACPASPIYYQRDPVQTTKTSVQGSINMLGLAKRTGARILLASTSEVYGDPLEHPQRETYWGHVNPIGRRSCYDEGKRCAETLFVDYRRQNETSITDRPNLQHLRPAHASAGRPGRLELHRPGPRRPPNHHLRRRHPDEVVLLCGRSRRRPHEVDRERGRRHRADQPGNPEEFTITDLAKEVVRLTGSHAGIDYLPLPSDDPVRRCPDISVAQQTIGWTPTTPLREGLPRAVDYFRALADG